MRSLLVGLGCGLLTLFLGLFLDEAGGRAEGGLNGLFTVLSLFASPVVALMAAFLTFVIIPTAPARELTREGLVDRALCK